MNGQWSPTALSFELVEVGNYNGSGLWNPASDRYGNYPSYDSYNEIGFRVTLYVNP